MQQYYYRFAQNLILLLKIQYKVGADKAWTNIITKYNSIPLVRKVNQTK
jgi:hypothetical protein